MNKLKVGDKVTLSPDTIMQKGLDAASTYTVAKIDRCFVYLDSPGYENIAWYESDLVKVGDNKHPHHDLMIQYANDTSIEIEVMETYYGWGVTIQPAWNTDREYRRKPKPERKPFNLAEAFEGKRVVNVEGNEVTQLVKFKTKTRPDTIYGVAGGIVRCWNLDASYGSCQLYMQELN